MEFVDWIVANEKTVRMSCFFGMIFVMASWEWLSPCRALSIPRAIHWANNLGIVFLNSFLLRLVFPAAAVGVALTGAEQNWGLFNQVSVSPVIAIILSIIVMDLVIYLQHVMVHAIPLLWRLHRVHHADPDYDFTTGARFHPIEIFLSMLIKFATIVLLGPPVVAVIIFEVILNLMAMFNHGNVQLPKALDRVIRWFVVTPDMHRVHHSIHDDEANSNFGFNLSLWDRLFGTYRDQPRDGHEEMTIGIRKYREARDVTWLPGMLWLPFRGKISDYAINRRQWNDDE